MDPDPRHVLARGRTSALAGRHEEALRDFVWFHQHALQHDRALYGVRLSFALGYWADLAEVYPPAMKALCVSKQQAERALLRGEGGRDLFHDLVSINRELRHSRDTYELFVALKAAHPEAAKRYGDLAIEAIVEAKDFVLAAEHLPHPESYLLWLSDRLNADLERDGVPRQTAIRRREAYVRNYCYDVRTALKILRGLRNYEAAATAVEWAIALVRPKHARQMVSAELTSK